MSISFGGIGEMAVTFEATSDVQAGCPVKMSDNGKVTSCDEEDQLIGVAVYVSKDHFATVQVKGYVSLPYSGETAPSVGFGQLSADGEGGVASDSTNGREYLIIDVDTTAETVGFYM